MSKLRLKLGSLFLISITILFGCNTCKKIAINQDKSRSVSEDDDIEPDEPLIGNEVFRQTDIPFTGLPNEVQEVILSMTGHLYITSNFYLSVTLTDDPAIDIRSVKTYTYTPLVFDENLNVETLASSYWIFKRRNKKLQLEYAELD